MAPNSYPIAGCAPHKLDRTRTHKALGRGMSSTKPPDHESAEEQFARISRMPGVRVQQNPNPGPWEPPTDIRVVNISDINELTADDWEDQDNHLTGS